MNIIEVMRLPVGTKIRSNLFDEQILKICEYDGVKVLQFVNSFRKVLLDSEATEAEYEIVEEAKHKKKRLVKCKNGEIQNFWFKGDKNPCNCGSNLFHEQLIDNKVIGVCNNCHTHLYDFGYVKDDIKEFKLI